MERRRGRRTTPASSQRPRPRRKQLAGLLPTRSAPTLAAIVARGSPNLSSGGALASVTRSSA
eukprot:1858517-Alexandrium_andersonii.AAC.1